MPKLLLPLVMNSTIYAIQETQFQKRIHCMKKREEKAMLLLHFQSLACMGNKILDLVVFFWGVIFFFHSQISLPKIQKKSSTTTSKSWDIKNVPIIVLPLLQKIGLANSSLFFIALLDLKNLFLGGVNVNYWNFWYYYYTSYISNSVIKFCLVHLTIIFLPWYFYREFIHKVSWILIIWEESTDDNDGQQQEILQKMFLDSEFWLQRK